MSLVGAFPHDAASSQQCKPDLSLLDFQRIIDDHRFEEKSPFAKATVHGKAPFKATYIDHIRNRILVQLATPQDINNVMN